MKSNINDYLSYKVVPDAPLVDEYGYLEGLDYDEVYVTDPLKYLIKSKYRVEWYKLIVL